MRSLSNFACILAAAAVMFVPSINAQAQPETPQPGSRLQELQQRLKLTDEQRQQIRPILEEEAAKAKDIRAAHQGDTSRRSRRAMLRALREVQQSAQKRISPILTKDQQSEWKKIREERRAEFRDQRG